MLYFLDTEFNEFGGDLISLALVCENGDELYLATYCERPGPWVAENVIPIIFTEHAMPDYIGPVDDFGRRVAGFLQRDKFPSIIADWPDDISYFCKAMITGPGQMVAIPRMQFNLLRIDAYPTELQGAVQHNALWDARALKEAFHAAQRP